MVAVIFELTKIKFMGEREMEINAELGQGRAERVKAYILERIARRFPSGESRERILVHFKGGEVEKITKAEKQVADFLKSLLESIGKVEQAPSMMVGGPNFEYLESEGVFGHEKAEMFNLVNDVLRGENKELKDIVFGGKEEGKYHYNREVVSDIKGVTFSVGLEPVEEGGKKDYRHFVRCSVYGNEEWQKKLPEVEKGLANNAELLKV